MGTVASNLRERMIANHYNSLSERFDVERPDVSDKYADFKITDNETGKSVWLEDKMSMKDRLMNTGAKFIDGVWSFNGTQNIFTEILTPILQENAQEWVDRYGITEIDNSTDENFEILREENEKGTLKFIIRDVIIKDFGKVVSDYYNGSKAEPCHYIQMGDNFYTMGEDVLGLGAPQLVGDGKVTVRWCINNKKGKDGIRRPHSVRTKTDTFFDVKSMVESPFSLKEGTEKLNPFA